MPFSLPNDVKHHLAGFGKVLPVTDTHNHLVGVVGRSDVLRILLEEG